MMQNHFYELEKRHTPDHPTVSIPQPPSPFVPQSDANSPLLPFLTLITDRRYEEEVKRLRSILDSRGLSAEHGAPAASGPMSGPPHLPASGASGPLPIASAGGPPPPGGPGGAGSAGMFGPNGNGAPGGPGSEYGRGPNGFDREREPLRGPTPGGKDRNACVSTDPVRTTADLLARERTANATGSRRRSSAIADRLPAAMTSGTEISASLVVLHSDLDRPNLLMARHLCPHPTRTTAMRSTEGGEAPTTADSPGTAAAAAGNVSLSPASPTWTRTRSPRSSKRKAPTG